MTENKRFVYYEHKGADYILDTPDTELDFIEMLGGCLEAEEIVDLLNKLNDENEQLKQYAQTSEKFTEYVEDFFKKYDFDTVNFDSLGEMIDTDNFFYEKSLKLEKENEQLKQEIKDLNDILARYEEKELRE